MTQTTTTYDFTISPNKRDTLKRLYDANQISFDELLLLAGDTIVNNYPQPAYTPYIPPFDYPIYPGYPTVSYSNTQN